MTDLDPVPRNPRAELLMLLLSAGRAGRTPVEDSLAAAVTAHAATLRATDADSVIPAMIAACEAIDKARAELADAAHAARVELDTELDRLNATDPDTGKSGDRPAFVPGLDGRTYRVSRDLATTTGFVDEPVVKMLCSSLRMGYRPPEGTPAHLAGVFGDEFEAGVAAGIEAARAGRSGPWKSGELGRHAHRLARAGDTAAAGLLEAAKFTTVTRKDTAKYKAVDEPTERAI